MGQFSQRQRWFSFGSAVFFLGLLATSVLAQPPIPSHPSGRRGVDGSTPYEVGDLGAVNLFNGNLHLTLPLFSRHVEGSLSYGLTLRYNSDIWDHENLVGSQRRAHLNPDHNAGAGWVLGFGWLYAPLSHPIHDDEDDYLLVEPDGTRRLLTPTLHPSDTATGGVFYTRDGSYLRLKIDTPSAGESTVESPSGTKRIFDTQGRVRRIEDPHGNSLDILYSASRWTLRDQHYTAGNGREHYVDFATPCAGGTPQVSRVEIAAFGGARAGWDLTYRTPCPTIDRYRHFDPGTSATVVVPLLESVSIPDGHGSEWSMGYALTGTTTADPEGTWSSWPCSPACLELDQNLVTVGGLLASVTQPTGGRTEWQYRKYFFNLPRYLDFPSDLILGETIGVAYRRRFHASGAEEGRWRYIQGPRPSHEVPEPQFSREARTWVTDPEGNVAVHYFFDAEEQFNDPTRVTDWRHGRPFTVNLMNGDRHLSRRLYEGAASLANLRRSAFVRYTADQLAEASLGNHRMESSKTLYHDDGAFFSEVTFSEFDGLGHYRKATTGGNFGAGNVRETFTGFHPGGGIYDYDRHNTTPGSDGIGTFVLPAVGSPWILTTYDEQSTTEGGVTQKQEHCFDAQGFLTRSRLLEQLAASPGRSPDDIVLERVPDAKGNVVVERSYGGDDGGLGSCDLCSLTLTPSNADSAMTHTYDKGVLETSEYLLSSGSGIGFLSVDRDIDASTGLVTASRDTAGVGAALQYDLLGRLTRATPRDSAYQAIAYGAPSGGETSVTSTLHDPGTGTELARSATVHDSFGRPFKQSVRFPGGTDRETDTAYNAMGWVLSVSELGSSGDRTVYSDFDAFGRPRLVTRPDGSQASSVYFGVRRMEQTITIAQAGGLQASTTSHVYDRQGRLERVIEPSRPDGSDATTTYLYDVGNRLIEVSSGAQTRLFSYDGRGFLLAEQHPEKGSAGNGSMLYGQYDARGLAGQVTDLVTLTYTYDRAARLLEVKEGSALWKTFSYYIANSAANGDARGKLQRAVRFNRSAWTGGGPLTTNVGETYRYRALDGAVSERDTRIFDGATPLGLFHQSWTYTALGDPSQTTYPCLASEGPSGLQCLASGDPAPVRTVQHGYDHGFLNSVSDNLGSWADSITYHSNGLLDRVSFPNGQAYFQGKDSNSMGRPGSIGADLGGTTIELSFSYDPAGNITRLADGNSGESYLYDPVGRVTEMRLDVGSYQQYAYDRQGNLTQIDTFQGDPMVLTSRPMATGASTNHLTGAGYDNAGNLTSWNPSFLAEPLASQSADQGLDEERWAGSPSWGLQPAKRSREATPDGQTSQHEQRVEPGIKPGASPPQGVLSEARGRPQIGRTSEDDSKGKNAQLGTLFYAYDPLGQMHGQSGAGRTQAYLYTADEEGIGVKTFDGSSFDTRWFLRGLGGEVLREYRERPANGADLYHADNFETDDLCAWWWNNGTTTGVPTCRGPGFIWNRDDIYRGSAHLGADSPSDGVPHSGKLFHFLDQLGSPRLLTNMAGQIVGGELTWAFGEQRQLTPLDSLPIPKRYTGHERDTNSPGQEDDLDYMHARYCSPLLGRFLSFDPIGGNPAAPQSWNRYAYVMGNPVRMVDRFGLAPDSVYHDEITVFAYPPADTLPNVEIGGLDTYREAVYYSVTPASQSADAAPDPTSLSFRDRIALMSRGPGSCTSANCQMLASVGQNANAAAWIEWGVSEVAVGMVATPANFIRVGSGAAAGGVRALARSLGAAGDDLLLRKAINSNLQHAAKRGVERSIFSSSEEAAAALRNLTTEITSNGFPAGTLVDTARSNRFLVPVGDGGLAVYHLARNGTAKLKTVLIAR